MDRPRFGLHIQCCQTVWARIMSNGPTKRCSSPSEILRKNRMCAAPGPLVLTAPSAAIPTSSVPWNCLLPFKLCHCSNHAATGALLSASSRKDYGHKVKWVTLTTGRGTPSSSDHISTFVCSHIKRFKNLGNWSTRQARAARIREDIVRRRQLNSYFGTKIPAWVHLQKLYPTRRVSHSRF